MDDNGQRENGRHKPVHAQWMMPQHQMKDSYTMKLMSILAERDAAIQERNLYISEKKAALAERDKAYLQRDAVIAEWNNAIIERDEFFAALTHETGINNGNSGPACPGSTAPRGTKHIYHQQHQQQLPHAQPSPPQLSDAPYDHAREMHISEAFPISVAPESATKSRRPKRLRKDGKAGDIPPNKASKQSKKSKKGEGEDLKHASVTKKHEWKSQDLGLNQVAFDESTMPAPGCSCTGEFHQCYKWGSGGWQSSCCTTTLSMHPLPVMPNRRHARVGGRKMSGSAFNKLLSRLAGEGHDLSAPVDLKDHWAKHGTNRYITIK